MADIKSSANPLFLREEELRKGIELLYFAYRDFNSEADEVLAEIGYGRAHLRVIHFVGRNPGVTVSQLLRLLAVTKQSLSRVLSQLINDGIVEQKQGLQDRRQRLVQLTEKGVQMERDLSNDQRLAFARAYRQAGGDAVQGFCSVLEGLIKEANRDLVRQTIT